jgi:hypothetical protein
MRGSIKGLEISVIAVVDVYAHQGYTRSVKQTATTDRQTSPLERSTAKQKRKSSSFFVMPNNLLGFATVNLASKKLWIFISIRLWQLSILPNLNSNKLTRILVKKRCRTIAL